MQTFRIIIPARYNSSRFPGKALAEIAGKPMIQHVYTQALKSGAESVVIATDDARIEAAAKKFGAPVCMTSPDHESATDRLAEVATKLNYSPDTIIVNVQGDEPLMPPEIITQVATALAERPEVPMATLCEPIESVAQLLAPNIAKVVLDHNNFALFFSRAPIPWDRAKFPLAKDAVLPPQTYFRHIGIYAYRASFLQQFTQWQPCAIELLECLEQLRVLWYGAKIYVAIAKASSIIGVDTPEDLEKVKQYFL